MEAKNEVLVDELRIALEYLMPDDVIGLNRMNDLPVYNRDGNQETMDEVTRREFDVIVEQKKAKEQKEKEEMDAQPDPNDRPPDRCA